MAAITRCPGLKLSTSSLSISGSGASSTVPFRNGHVAVAFSHVLAGRDDFRGTSLDVSSATSGPSSRTHFTHHLAQRIQSRRGSSSIIVVAQGAEQEKSSNSQPKQITATDARGFVGSRLIQRLVGGTSESSAFDETSPSGSDCLVEDGPKRSLTGESSWTKRVANTKLGKIVGPIVASIGFYLQVSGATFAEVDSSVSSDDEEFITFLLTAGFFTVLYLFIIPAITYNYLRLRWYRRNAAETFFQFMLVFLFFPGMLLLAPFINFRRLPKEGTEPP